MNSNLNTLSKKIQTLSAEQITEVEDFVEFLRYRGQDRELARSAAAGSSPALEAIWSNPEDDVYDAVLVRGRGPRPVSVYEPSHFQAAPSCHCQQSGI
jgi:hypothetical protein